MKMCRSYNLQHMHGWELMKRKFTPMRGGVWRVPDNTLVCTCRSQDARCIQSSILTILLRWGEPLISFIRPCLLRWQLSGRPQLMRENLVAFNTGLDEKRWPIIGSQKLDLNSCVKKYQKKKGTSMRRGLTRVAKGQIFYTDKNFSSKFYPKNA